MLETWSLSPELVWGLYQRGLGLLFLISFASLSGQMLSATGTRSGIGMISRRLAKLRSDFPTWRRFFYFPTLLWFNHSDAVLRAVPLIGMAAAALVIYGGAFSFWALVACYLCYLTLDLPIALIFPWDCLLFESTILALFLPQTHPLPMLEAVSAPAPALTWAFRLLVFRVMFGFGKQKFIGSRPKDLAYLKGFLVNQPLLSPVGWYAQKLPVGLLKTAVLYMFLAEIPIPFFAFFPGWPSVVCAAATTFLMVGIQLMGSFGYFSLLTICGCIPLLDNVTPQTLSFTDLFAAGQPVFTNAYVLVHTIGALVVFPFNSWIGQSWSLWAAWYQLPRWTMLPLHFFRMLHPFRWLHPYGVFPPNSQPGVKITLLLEVTWDREHWEEIEFTYAPTNAMSRPHFVAPHHPRGDQAVIYDTFGLNPSSLISAMLGPWDPNPFASRLAAVAFCQSILDGTALVMTKSGPLQERSERPLAARITTIMLEPASLAEHRKTGAFWKRTYIGPHVPDHEHDPQFWDDVFGEPELWHFEAIFWRRRSKLRSLIDRAQAGRDDPRALVRYDGAFSEADVETFWSELVPLISGETRTNLQNLPRSVAALEARFDRTQRRTMYRLFNRFALVLVARLEPMYLHHGGKPEIPVRTYFHLWMLAHHIIGSGKQAYLAAAADPRSVVDHIPALTNHSGLYALSMFRFEELVFEAQKLRLIDAVVHPHNQDKKREIQEILRQERFDALLPVERFFVRMAQRVSGFFNVVPTIRENFLGPDFDRGYPELYPIFDELDSGEILLRGTAPLPPDRPLAKDLKSMPQASEPETDQSDALASA